MARTRISITLPQECVECMNKQVQSKFKLEDFSVEVLVLEAMKFEGEGF